MEHKQSIESLERVYVLQAVAVLNLVPVPNMRMVMAMSFGAVGFTNAHRHGLSFCACTVSIFAPVGNKTTCSSWISRGYL